MIFKILKIRNTVKEIRENPGKFAGGEVGGMFVSLFVLPLVIFIFILGGLYLLGFTGFLRTLDPGNLFLIIVWYFSRVLFFTFSVLFVLFIIILIKSYKFIKKSLAKKLNQTIEIESKVVE